MSKETGGPAFARPASDAHAHGMHKHQDGMTLRDYFAAKAMQGVLMDQNNRDVSPANVSQWAYRHADAMLLERTK